MIGAVFLRSHEYLGCGFIFSLGAVWLVESNSCDVILRLYRSLCCQNSICNKFVSNGKQDLEVVAFFKSGFGGGAFCTFPPPPQNGTIRTP